jgi:hypothetical protein
LGISQIVTELKKIEEKYGAFYKPDPLLEEMAQKGKGFYT